MSWDPSDWNGAPSTEQLRKSYDDIPYANWPKPFTHVSRIGAVGQLRGLNPAPPAQCRVLELGCADGGNLLPMAEDFPASEFVGIDLSNAQVESGQRKVRALEFSNVDLRAMNILDLGAGDLGMFDYLIVHGVYSWVPSPVQEQILSICRDHLSESGIAYISYNTYPGWRGKQAIQEMLRFHTGPIADFREKVEAGFELLGVLPGASQSPDNPAAIVADRIRQDLEKSTDPATYLLHEFLVDFNEPLYFLEFVRRIQAARLQYVDDAYPGSTSLARLSPTARQWVAKQFDDYLQQQQYVDFLGNIAFRRSLVCRESVPLRRELSFERLRTLHVNATCRREESEDGSVHFRTDSRRRFTIEHPGLRAMLEKVVNARPASVPVSQLCEVLGDDSNQDEATEMLEGLLNGAAIEFKSHPVICARRAGEFPRTSRLVRYDAADGLVTTSAHRSIRLESAFERRLLPLLDGTRTVPELIATLQQQLKPDKPLTPADWEQLVDDSLTKMLDHGLLCDPQ